MEWLNPRVGSGSIHEGDDWAWLVERSLICIQCTLIHPSIFIFLQHHEFITLQLSPPHTHNSPFRSRTGLHSMRFVTKLGMDFVTKPRFRNETYCRPQFRYETCRRHAKKNSFALNPRHYAQHWHDGRGETANLLLDTDGAAADIDAIRLVTGFFFKPHIHLLVLYPRVTKHASLPCSLILLVDSLHSKPNDWLMKNSDGCSPKCSILIGRERGFQILVN